MMSIQLFLLVLAAATTTAMGDHCFAGSTVVYVDSRAVAMHDLVIGDYVLDAKNQLTEIIGFTTHKTAIAKMLMFWSNRELVLTVSPEHILIDSSGDYKYASDFTIGDELMSGFGAVQIELIVEVEKEELMISPMTKSGTLIAGDARIHVSCYSHVNTHLVSPAHAYIRARSWMSPHTGDTHLVEKVFLFILKMIGFAR